MLVFSAITTVARECDTPITVFRLVILCNSVAVLWALLIRARGAVLLLYATRCECTGTLLPQGIHVEQMRIQIPCCLSVSSK